MATQRAIPILRTIINDLMDLYLVLRETDVQLARYYTKKIAADIERIKEFLEQDKEDA